MKRHGGVFAQFTLWFGANLQITAIVTGALSCVRRDVFWSIIGLLVGQCFGAAVMALHAAQGPKLGLPQMISAVCNLGFMARVFQSYLFALCILVLPQLERY